MKVGQIIRKGTPEAVLLAEVKLTESWSERLQGLLGKQSLPVGAGLLLRPCNSIHTCFMHFPIDVIFLDTQGRVTKLVEDLVPWRLSGERRSAMVLEATGGFISRSRLQVGDHLVWREGA